MRIIGGVAICWVLLAGTLAFNRTKLSPPWSGPGAGNGVRPTGPTQTSTLARPR